MRTIDTWPNSGGRREFRWLIIAPDSVKAVRLDASCPTAERLVRSIELD